MSATSKVVVRCFRRVCVCRDYFKVNHCLPETRKDYELCYKKSETEYLKTFKVKDVYTSPELWKNPPLL